MTGKRTIIDCKGKNRREMNGTVGFVAVLSFILEKKSTKQQMFLEQYGVTTRN